jgi:putative ABC transport system permease protein
MRSEDLGFRQDQIMVLEAPSVYDSTADERVVFFQNEVRQLPMVKNAASSYDVPGKSMVERSSIGPENSQKETDYFPTFISGIDTSFFSTYDLRY